ncbi:HAMP domain-containing sensor histidine kinase [Actinomadura sp. HBU206391]|uniref:sensor histidine kinase n=1 Tax=Actinomadura sp. HBU206391 TaxID=2731692 RepID=UPI002905E3A9|nr:HAMP domain-containing sensor histidine kinase [Actinomadura sp. HBU206391]
MEIRLRQASPAPALRRLSRTSLRTRLVLITVALVAIGLTVGYAIVIGALAGYQTDRIDDRIRPTAELMSRAPAIPQNQRSRPPSPQDLTPVFDMLGFSYLAYVLPDGGTAQVVHHPSAEGRAGPRLPRLDAAAVAARGGRPFDVPDEPGSSRWRVIVLRIESPALPLADGRDLRGSSVVVAASRAETDATIARLRTISLVTGSAILVVLTAVGWSAVRAGMRPLSRIEATAAAIAGGDLTHRIPDLGAPRTEVGRLSVSLNSMLAQIERGFAARAESEARMRRFVADVSHELRTPLFGIKGFTDLYRMGAMPGPDDIDHTMGRIEREATRLANLTENLLLLARLDEHSEGDEALPLELSPMDLRTLAADAQHDLRALDPSRPIELTGPGGGTPGGAPVLGDEERLRQVVSNLVGNAVTHTPAGGGVRIGVGTLDDRAILEIEDHGPGLPPEQAERVFDRFYRADGSRSRGNGGGAGLGLALARSLVAAHGGRIELDTAPGAGARFRISIPITADDGEGDGDTDP